MKKVLIVTDVDFWNQGAGHRMRIAALINYLGLFVDLQVAYTGFSARELSKETQKKFPATIRVLSEEKKLSPVTNGKKFRQLLKSHHFETIIIEYIHNSYLLNYLIYETQLILDAHDIISDRTNQFKEFGAVGNLYELSEEDESRLFNVYDKVIVLCEPDRVKTLEMTGYDNVLLCPHPVPVKKHQIRSEVKNITFVASEYIPNVDAIVFFLKECWPILQKHRELTLSIYGSICRVLTGQEQAGLILNGFVDELETIYQYADIVINPVRFGAGLKIKNVEAMANGIPLITTSHGARGFESAPSETYLIADNAVDFIEKISLLVDNHALRKQMSNRSIAFINRNFSPENCFSPLLSAITTFC